MVSNLVNTYNINHLFPNVTKFLLLQILVWLRSQKHDAYTVAKPGHDVQCHVPSAIRASLRQPPHPPTSSVTRNRNQTSILNY